MTRDHHVDRRVVGRHRDRRRRTDVQAHHGAGLLTRAEERVPVVGVEARVSQLGGVLRERDRATALLGDAVDLRRHQVGVPDGHDGQRHEAAGVRAAPLVDVPVVVALQQTQTEVAVGGAAEQLPAEAGHRREAHRAEHAVDVHVAHALVDVVRALADLVERGGLEAVLLGRTAGDRVEPDVGDGGALELPHVGVHLVDVDHAGRALEVGLRHVALPHVGRLDDVVVDADEDEVVQVHGVCSPGDRAVSDEPTPTGAGTPPSRRLRVMTDPSDDPVASATRTDQRRSLRRHQHGRRRPARRRVRRPVPRPGDRDRDAAPPGQDRALDPVDLRPPRDASTRPPSSRWNRSTTAARSPATP